jgi:hypothetical protein
MPDAEIDNLLAQVGKARDPSGSTEILVRLALLERKVTRLGRTVWCALAAYGVTLVVLLGIAGAR